MSGRYVTGAGSLGFSLDADLEPNGVLVTDSGEVIDSKELSSGQIIIGRTGNTPVAGSITGRADSIIVTNGSGSITLSTPQDIGVTSSPTFSSISLGSLSVGTGTISNFNYTTATGGSLSGSTGNFSHLNTATIGNGGQRYITCDNNILKLAPYDISALTGASVELQSVSYDGVFLGAFKVTDRIGGVDNLTIAPNFSNISSVYGTSFSRWNTDTKMGQVTSNFSTGDLTIKAGEASGTYDVDGSGKLIVKATSLEPFSTSTSTLGSSSKTFSTGYIGDLRTGREIITATSGTAGLTVTSGTTTGLQVIPYTGIPSGNDSIRMFMNEDTTGTNGFSIGYNGAATNEILNWTGNSFNIARHNTSATGTVSLSINRAGGMTVNETTAFSTLSASSLVATDSSKNLTSSISSLTPTLTGIVLDGGNINIQRSGITRGSIYISGNEFVIAGNATGSLRLYSQNGSIIYSVDNGASFIGHNALNFFPGTSGTVNLGTSANRWASVNSLSGNFSDRILMSGSVASRLRFSNVLQNRIIEMWQNGDNDNEYFGFGINNNMVRYQVGALGSDHVFYAATGPSGSNELFRITGLGRSRAQDGTVALPAYSFVNDTNTGIYRIGADNLGISCNGTKILDVSATGLVVTGGISTTTTPSFKAFVSPTVTNVTGNGTTYKIIFNNEDHDNGSNFNTSTGEFTAPSAGRYSFTTTVYLSDVATAHTTAALQIIKDVGGVATSVALTQLNPWALAGPGIVASMTASTVIQLAASNKVYVNVQVTGGALAVDLVNGEAYTQFCGFRIL